MNGEQQILASFLAPFLDHTRETLGERRLQKILEELGASARELEDPTHWVSLRFTERFCERLAEEHDDPALFDQCGRMAFSERYMGLMLPIVRAFGSPGFGYDAMSRSLPRFNKVGEISVVKSKPGLRVLEYRAVPGAPQELSPYICLTRQSQMAAIPTVFGLPPAKVDHPRCMQDGAESCVYTITWEEPRRGLLRWGLSGAGAVAGLALAVPLWSVALRGPALGLIGALLGRSLGQGFELRRELAARATELSEHDEALLRLAQDNERRFAELQRAKANVEKQVEERTAELRATSETLRRTLREVRKLDRSRSQFFANVSHELRTPLQLILGPIEDLVRGDEPPGGREGALREMAGNARRLHLLIDNLLALSRADAGQVELRRAAIAPAAFVRHVADTFASAAARRGVTLAIEAPDDTPLVSLDPNWLSSALTNLVANALRATPSGGRVTLRFQDEGDELRFEVEDTGQGIAEEDLERVFDRFAQSGEESIRRGGAGLGLAIVREAARLHDGEVRVESRLGQGSKFTLRLPRVLIDRRASPAGESSTGELSPYGDAVLLDSVVPETTEGLPDLWDGPGSRAPLALVVEDHEELRRHVGDILAARCRVRAVGNGEAALELALAEPPDVVVTDISMPKMDGLELCRALVADERTRGAPVILLTAHQQLSTILAGYEAGASDYVTKPFHGRELQARVEVQLRLRSLLSEVAHKERLAGVGILAAEVAHHIRNPLSVVNAGMDLMINRLPDPSDDQVAALARTMRESARRIDQLIGDLLHLSVNDTATAHRFDLAEELRSAIRLTLTQLPDEVKLRFELDQSLPILGRPGEIGALLLNFLDNARRAVGDRGAIEVRGFPEGDRVVITVDDDGPGIDPADFEVVFEPFFTTRAPGEGTGLGLSIARQVATRHGGEVTAGASPLGGARFQLTLPLSPDEP